MFDNSSSGPHRNAQHKMRLLQTQRGQLVRARVCWARAWSLLNGIEMPFESSTHGRPKNRVLGGSREFHRDI